MYCHNCGKEVGQDMKFCPYCGAQLDQIQSFNSTITNNDNKSFGYALLSFFVPIVGIVFYVLWKDEFPMRAKSCLKGFVAGIVLYIVFVCCFFSSVFSIISHDEYSDSSYYDGELYDDFPFH